MIKVLFKAVANPEFEWLGFWNLIVAEEIPQKHDFCFLY
jgi:hypothetical protein